MPYPVESQLSGIERHEDRMWYRRTFTVPAGLEGRSRQAAAAELRRRRLAVRGVCQRHKVAEHKGGYDKFSADITDALKPGRTQELIVGVYDPTDAADGENPPMGKQRLDPSGIWYTPSSGIWQTVWMEPVAADHADSLKLTPDVAGREGHRRGARAYGTGCRSRRPCTTGSARSGRPPAAPDRRWTCACRTRICGPRTTRILYELKVTVGSDRVGSYFGMRSIAVEKVNGTPRTVLNGKPVFLMATLDQGFWPDGLHTAPTDEALAYDLKMHKAMGFNSVRKHIKVEPDRWFYWADRLGLLVWQDMPAMNTVNPSAAARAEYEHEMKEMIDEHIQPPVRRHVGHVQRGLGPVRRGPHRRPGQVLGPDPAGQQHVGPQPRASTAAPATSSTSTATRARPCHRARTANAPWSAASTADSAWRCRATPGPCSSRTSRSTQSTYTDDYLAKLDEVRKLACKGSNGAVYTQISDVEGELNGLLTYDRRIVKPDVKRIKAAQDALIRDASNPVVAGCPTA